MNLNIQGKKLCVVRDMSREPITKPSSVKTGVPVGRIQKT